MEKIIGVESPLVSGQTAEHIKDVSVNYLIKGYKAYGVDVTRFFEGLDKLSIFKCPASGYCFFYPGNVTGDSGFYEALQRFDWYYMPWKWEHEMATSYLKDGMSVLEVGCAHGAFLYRASKQFRLSEAIGLELNESAPAGDGVFEIYNQSIQSFEISNAHVFDVVCTYQVLEHISDVGSFLRSAIGCLKSGGRLIISVPNNAGFVGDMQSVLNMPPHHVGLWSAESLGYLENVYPVKLVDMLYEPLQDYHVDSYLAAMFYSGYWPLLSKIKRRVDKVTGRYYKNRKTIFSKKDSLIGHTVMAVFEKL